MRKKFINRHNAFGLVEVLITVVVLSIGLLGLASLQNKSVQSVQEGDNLVTASMIAEEMAKRMMANPYITSLGRQGYLATDLNGDVAAHGGVPGWVSYMQTTYPQILNCYSTTNSQSCYDSGATIGNSTDHITALTNMQKMDEVEMRDYAWNALPNGLIKICFDSTTAYTNWSCDNVATRVSARNENVYTIKVQWTNLFSNTSQIYALQFTAECTNSGATYCG